MKTSQSLLNRKEAAKMLGICERTVSTLTQKGELPTVRIGSRVLFDPADVQNFIDSKKVKKPR